MISLESLVLNLTSIYHQGGEFCLWNEPFRSLKSALLEVDFRGDLDAISTPKHPHFISSNNRLCIAQI